jgi:DUF4097 and DUF4098 domain-containing protein YvlB
MMKRILGIGLLLASLASGTVLAAGESVDETKKASDDGFVRITVVRGELDVQGWDRSEIRVTGRLDEQTEEFIFDVREGDAIIEVKLPRNIHSWCCEDGSDLEVMVPVNSRVDVSFVSTETTVSNVTGGIDIDGVSGDVDISDVSDRVDVTVVSGDLTLRNARGRVELKTVSGDLDANDVEGDVQLHSVSGDLMGSKVSGELDLETVSGDVELRGASYESLSGHSVSGNVDIEGMMKEGGTLDFGSVSGTVRVEFEGNIDARFDLESGSGRIRNRVTDDKPETSKYVRNETLRFVTGGGKGEVVIGTRSGDIVISR